MGTGATGTGRLRALRTLGDNPAVVAVAVFTLLAAVANGGVTAYAVVYLTDGYGLSLGVANVVLTGLFVVGAVAILVGSYLTDRVGSGRILVGSYLGLTAVLGLIAVEVVPAVAVIGLFLLLGGVRSLGSPARDELTGRLATRGTVAKSFAVVTIGLMLGNAIAPPLFGYPVEVASVQTAFVAIFGVALGATVVTLVVVTRFVGGSN